MKNNQVLIFKLLSFTVLGAMGTFGNYINLYLEQALGFTGSQIGLVAMISMSLVIVVNPILGYIGDKTGKHLLMLKIAFFSSTIAVAIYSQLNTFVMILLIGIIFEISRSCIPPFIDLLISDYCAKSGDDFGKIRVYSSMGFMITVMAVGFAIAGLHLPWFNGTTIGFDGFLSLQTAIFTTIVVFFIISFGLLFLIKTPTKEKQEKDSFSRKDVVLLMTNKQFQFVLVFMLLSLVTLESAKTFVGNHLVIGLGSAENIVSIMTFVMVLPEFILLPFGTKIVRKVGFKNFYVLTILTMLGRMLVYAFTTNIGIFALASAVHGLGIVVHIAGNIAFVRKVVEPKILGLALTIMMSVMAVGRAILTFVYGVFYEQFDGFAVFRVASVLLFCGFLWVVRSKSLKTVGNEIMHDILIN